MNSFSAVLPTPPSTNDLWRPVIARGRSKTGGPMASMIRTAAYKNWVKHAGYLLNTAHCSPVPGRYMLGIAVAEAEKPDLDNLIKAVSDLLEEHGLIENDRECWALNVTRRADMLPGNIIVMVGSYAG